MISEPGGRLADRLPYQCPDPVVVWRAGLRRGIELRVRRVEHEVARLEELCEPLGLRSTRREVLFQAAARPRPQVVGRVDQTHRCSHLLAHANPQQGGEVGAEE